MYDTTVLCYRLNIALRQQSFSNPKGQQSVLLLLPSVGLPRISCNIVARGLGATVYSKSKDKTVVLLHVQYHEIATWQQKKIHGK